MTLMGSFQISALDAVLDKVSDESKKVMRSRLYTHEDLVREFVTEALCNCEDFSYLLDKLNIAIAWNDGKSMSDFLLELVEAMRLEANERYKRAVAQVDEEGIVNDDELEYLNKKIMRVT